MNKKLLLIFEGCDGTGKSTIVHRLFIEPQNYAPCFGLNSIVIHNSVYPTRNDLLIALTSQIFTHSNKHVILDRCHLSDMIYGPVLRNEPEDNSDMFLTNCVALEFQMEMMYIPIVIHCRPPEHIAIANWANRKNEELVKDDAQIREIYYRYGGLRDMTSLNVFEYDYTSDPYARCLVGRIGNHLEKIYANNV